MDQTIIYLTLEQILIIHEEQIDRYGGSHGLQDLALLESAIFRPQTTFSGEDLYKTLFDKAAALLHSILLNHPFVDGNRRTSFVATYAFLMLNGLELTIKEEEVIETLLDVESKKLGIEYISFWLRDNSAQVK